LIDDHAHPFATEAGPLDLASLSLDLLDDGALGERWAAQGSTRLMQELLTVRLARRLGCDPEEVVAARAEAASDWGAYVSGLFRDAGIEAALIDVGIWEGGAESLDRCAELSGVAMRSIHRIDPTVDQLIEAGADAGAIVEEVVAGMQGAVAGGAVGFKTILAYRTGLAVDPRADLAAAEGSLHGDEPVRRRGKACRDLVFRTALGVAGELGVPFQVHTGLGDSDIRLADSNPLLLEELLRSEEGRSVPIVLIHGSYPWHEEAAFLATTKPNVYTELSLSNIFAPLTVAGRLGSILELAPAAKVVLGTDGHSEPESFWFAATLLQEAWGEVRSRMKEAGARASWLDDVEARIFERNARELYRL
jgi:uncharacterized protein